MIEGVSGALVLLGPPDRGPFSPIAVWPNPRRNMKYLTAAAERALTERRGLLLRREPGGDPEAPSRLHYHVAYPVEGGGRLHGVVVLEVSSRPEPDLQWVLRQLHWGSAWLEVLFARDQAAQDDAARKRLQTVLETAAVAVGHERFYAAATGFVTALATRLGCDRVSLGFVRGGRTQVRAISHSAHFRKQANLVSAIGVAMDEALDQHATVVHPPDAGRGALITRAHVELARVHGAGAVCSIPLASGGRTFGVLTLERPPESSFDTATVELCEGIAALAGPMLELERREDRWLVVKGAEACRQVLAQVVGPGHVAMKVAAVALAGVVVFFALAKGDYRVSATTVIEAAIRRASVAPFNGYIFDARVRAGDLVRQGQALAVLDDRELRLERLKWASQHEQLVKQYHQAMAAHNRAQVSILAAQVDQAKAQLALLEDQLARTRILAPFNGIVVTGDLSQSLGSPVERGQVLFEIAPLDAYRVILQVDERDIADVAVGQRGDLVLSGFPTEQLPLTVEKLTPVSTAREGRNYFRVESQLRTTPERLRPGMEGVAKIEIDRRRLIWIWTHQVIDWIRLALWTWLP
jgi:RND family efflux transporter MFP subunit